MSIDVLVTSSGGRGWEWTPATERRIVRVKPSLAGRLSGAVALLAQLISSRGPMSLLRI